MRLSPLRRDRYALYEAAVQGVEFDLDFLERVYRRHHGRGFTRLREDFCGTAAISCGWAARGADRRALGVDLDAAPLEWARRHHLPRLRGAARRVTLLRSDVRHVIHPRVDVVAALNFSWWVFKERPQALRYLRAARRSLRRGGLLFLHAFGGSGAMQRLVERSRIPASQGPDGLRLPGFTYVWEQARFNPVDHHLLCHIHFDFPGGRRLRRAFSYDWRLWTLAETQDLLREAGFRGAEVYVQGATRRLDDAGDPYLLRRRFANREGWLAFVVGIR